MKTFEAIMNIPSPYRVYLFEKLAQQLESKGIVFEVHFMTHSHGERPKSWINPEMHFAYRYWRDFGILHRHFNPGLIIRSWFKKVDVLLVGSPFDTFTGILAAFTARAKIKCTWVEGQTKTPGKMKGIIGFFKRLVLSRFKYVAVPGNDASRYIALHQALTKFSMPKPVFLPNLISETRFCPRAMWPKTYVDSCREKIGARDDERICLIPARLDVCKGLLPFFEVLDSELIKKGWRIVVMGEGELREQILEIVRNKDIADRVSIFDYVPYVQMPVFYASSDLFLLPSLHDPNPLSVPEALHSGLPIALSEQAGNVEEGVTEGRNGWRLPVNNTKELKKKIEEVFSTPVETLRKMGQFSLTENAQFWNTEKAISNFIKAIGL